MLQKAEKISDGYQIIIPETIAEQCGINRVNDIDVKVRNNSIVIEIADHTLASSITCWHKDSNRSEMYLG